MYNWMRTDSMDYIKKFVEGNDHKGGTRELEVAKQWIKEGRNVQVIVSDKKESVLINDFILDIEENGKIIILKFKNRGDRLYYGFDDNLRTLLGKVKFYNESKGKYIRSVAKAKVALKKGNNVRAVNDEMFKTSYIVAFFDNNTFETISGSVYKIE